MTKILLLALGAGVLPLPGLPVSQELLVRLKMPLSTMAKAGVRFEAVVTGCAQADCAAILPEGSTIQGSVDEVKPVRFGVRRERASMKLAFDGCRMPDGGPVACRTTLIAMDNARETVTDGNRIHGILAANHPHSYLGGLWIRPTSALLSRSVSGMTGAGRMVYRGLSPHPLMGGAIIGARLLFQRLPDPEIYFPVGAEMLVRVTGEAHPEITAVSAGAQTESWLRAAPVQVRLPDGKAATDIINIAFRGTREEVESAFQGAGWVTADALTTRTFARSYRAFTSMEAYPTAPVSPLRYEDRLPDLVFQKSFNSMAKRHHIRLWEIDSPDGPVWLGAATHDVGIVFDWKRMLMTHKIDPEIDRERDRVLADLSFSGCVARTARVERPELAVRSGRVSTDGALHVMEPHPCYRTSAAGASLAVRPKAPLGTVILRRVVLESRNYLLRGNAYYWAFRGLKSRQMLGRFTAPQTTLAGGAATVGKTSWRRGSESNRRMRALQTLALPLGYRAAN